MATHQSFLPQIYKIFNTCILFGRHSPRFSPQIIYTAEFNNVFSHQYFPLYGTQETATFTQIELKHHNKTFTNHIHIMPILHFYYLIPYCGKILRTINFTVFENFTTTLKINSSKSYYSIESYDSL